jgi:electron transfer flavoprotein alpha subunit
MTTLLWIEHDGKKIHPASLNLVASVQALPGPKVAMLMGHHLDGMVEQLATIQGLDEVLLLDAPIYFPFRPEPVAKALAYYAKDYKNIVAVSTTQAKNIFPRMAALLDQYMLSDVVKILSPDSFVRPIYAGNALLQEKVQGSQVIFTIRASAFEKATIASKSAAIRKLGPIEDDARSRVVATAKPDESMPDLQTARIVVSGGRGFGDAEKFKQVEKLAKVFGAAVGATRAAVDAGFISNDHHVGQTGKVVAPELYIAIGISGAIQHLAGMKDSKTIVAINKDPEAPIFEIASYGLVGDLFTIVPQMMEELSKLNN